MIQSIYEYIPYIVSHTRQPEVTHHHPYKRAHTMPARSLNNLRFGTHNSPYKHRAMFFFFLPSYKSHLNRCEPIKFGTKPLTIYTHNPHDHCLRPLIFNADCQNARVAEIIIIEANFIGRPFFFGLVLCALFCVIACVCVYFGCIFDTKIGNAGSHTNKVGKTTENRTAAEHKCVWFPRGHNTWTKVVFDSVRILRKKDFMRLRETIYCGRVALLSPRLGASCGQRRVGQIASGAEAALADDAASTARNRR